MDQIIRVKCGKRLANILRKHFLILRLNSKPTDMFHSKLICHCLSCTIEKQPYLLIAIEYNLFENLSDFVY